MPDDNFDEEWAREAAEEEADLRRKAEPGPKLSQDEFLVWRSPRSVKQHAARFDNPLWHWLVRTRWDAYNANKIYAGPSPFDAGPMWCFDRFGKSETVLPDGRVIHIGGEHEDSYDPDFFIYNDVTVIDPNGEIAIYGYPVEDFPPTDFHTATRVGKSIFIIGRLGYPEQRLTDATPVYQLALESMHVGKVATRGDSPGWIHRQNAVLADDGFSIIVSGGMLWRGADRSMSENIDSWALNSRTGEWKRLTQRDWQRWTIRRVDRKRNRLWEVRQALWNRNHANLGLDDHWRFDDAPNFEALEMLYRLDADAPPPTQGSDYNSYSAGVDGLVVRFKEDHFWIEVIVEGRLAEARLRELQRNTLELIEKIEASACEIECSEAR
jgi:hypothetical protein